jgi:hypothetical protein
MGGTNDRLRFSVSIDAANLFTGENKNQFTDDKIKQAAGLVDEFCWLRTVINGRHRVDGFETEVPALGVPQVWRQMVNAAKDAHVQLMVGFAHASTFITERGKAFLAWLYSDTPSPTLALWAESLGDYCSKNFPGMSGISFDLENISQPGRASPPAGEILLRGQRWSDFYGAVATEFKKRGWMVGAFLKPKVSDTQGTTFPDKTVGYHLYEMANGHDNLILRPMAYEANPQGGMIQWFDQICDYAVGKQGSGGKCSAENFQLALKVASSRNAGQVITSDAGNVVPELGIVGRTDVQNACVKVLRPHLTGICLFPGGGGASYWKDINAWLNGGNRAGSTKGWPKQHPLAQDPPTEFSKI